MAKTIITLLVTMLALSASAQHAVGDWNIHTSFVGNTIVEVAETDQWVYYLTGTNLFRLDKETQENEALSLVNDLSDMVISQIHYNSDKDYLVIIYSNSNIDIIKSNGAVVNMPEIKDAVLTTGKAINDVTFAPGLIYVATDFGYVVLDDSKFVVKESHVYREAFTSVAQVGDKLLLASKNHLYCGSANEYHEQLSSFATPDFKTNCTLFPISENSFFCVTDNTTYCVTMTNDGEQGKDYNLEALFSTKATVIQKTKDGYLLVNNNKKCYKTDENGLNPVVIENDAEMCSAHPDGDGTTLWAAGANGLHQVGSDSYYLPNALSYPRPYWMTYNNQRDLLYVASTTANAIVRDSSPTAVNTYDGMKWSDVTPEGAPQRGSYWIEFMPDDPDTYFMGTWRDGLLKVYENEIVLKYDTTNSPLCFKGSVDWGTMHPITSIDRNGNLWAIQSRESEDHPVIVLPAAKTKLESVSVNDWITPTIKEIQTDDSQRASFLSTKNSSYDIKLYTDGRDQNPLFIWNNNGQIQQLPPQEKFNSFSDQDGEIVSWTRITCLTEDLNGNVWMGYTEGICVFNPALAFKEGSTFYVTRPKIPRNDGTGYADRLMDGIQVNCVAIDGANRKWIGTNSSGLFLVSPNGDQIIRKFNTTNSPLASNTIYQVCCNPNSNSVYVTTPAGLYEYFSDSSPAESSYDNIYAYPNPVRPDFTGDVTIVGLMDNSLVKIADASGNVIRQLKSTGGMTTWDCCDYYGNAVKSGVYFVLCSRANGSGEAVVSKIAVIR